MYKLVYCIRKRADIEPQEFYRYWLEEHAGLVKSVAAEIGACRYIQSHTVMPEVNTLFQASRAMQAPYDGITEVWWESEADMQLGLASEAGQAAGARLLDDERNFIDFDQSCMFITEEHAIF